MQTRQIQWLDIYYPHQAILHFFQLIKTRLIPTSLRHMLLDHHQLEKNALQAFSY